MKTRIVITVVVLAIIFGLSAIYGEVEGPLEGAAAVQQLNGGNAEYVAARAVSEGRLLTLTKWAGFVFVGAMWGLFLASRRKMNNVSPVVVLCFLAILAGTGCVGPYQVEVMKEIKPSETAFLVQLEGDTKNQDVFKSIEFLEQHKVGTKRVTIPTRKRKLGRGPGNFEWVETAILIPVDRKPVTREWTKSEATGTSNADEAIHVESKDSIGFAVGINITTSIPEDMAATFLYNFSGKSLEQVTDQNIRGFVSSELSREFGMLDLEAARAAKGEIILRVLPKAQEFFKGRGITIEYMGIAEGLTYDQPAIQEAIDRKFRAEMDVQTAKQEALAQVERNTMIVSKAVAEREAAQEFAKAREAAEAKVSLDIRRIAAEKWNGNLPDNIVPEGSPLLFGLDARTKQNN